MNEEDEWNQVTVADTVEETIEAVSRQEVVKAIGEMKTRKAAGPSGVSVEMITANGEVWVFVMMK